MGVALGVRADGRVDRAGVEEGVERHLGVDDHVLAAGQAHDEVGAQPAVVAGGGHLLGEVAAVDQARELDDPAQVQLSPAPAHLGLAERGRQGRGLPAQHVGGVPDVVDLLLELALPRDAVLGHVPQLVVQPVEAVAHHGGVGGAPLRLRDRPLP